MIKGRLLKLYFNLFKTFNIKYFLIYYVGFFLVWQECFSWVWFSVIGFAHDQFFLINILLRINIFLSLIYIFIYLFKFLINIRNWAGEFLLRRKHIYSFFVLISTLHIQHTYTCTLHNVLCRAKECRSETYRAWLPTSDARRGGRMGTELPYYIQKKKYESRK